MKYLLILIAGFLLHKVTDEVINLKLVFYYKKCVKTSNKAIEKSPYQQCRYNLEYNTIESIIMYQPRFWDEFK